MVKEKTEEYSRISLVTDFSRQLPVTPEPTSYAKQSTQFKCKNTTLDLTCQ